MQKWAFWRPGDADMLANVDGIGDDMGVGAELRLTIACNGDLRQRVVMAGHAGWL